MTLAHHEALARYQALRDLLWPGRGWHTQPVPRGVDSAVAGAAAMYAAGEDPQVVCAEYGVRCVPVLLGLIAAWHDVRWSAVHENVPESRWYG